MRCLCLDCRPRKAEKGLLDLLLRPVLEEERFVMVPTPFLCRASLQQRERLRDHLQGVLYRWQGQGGGPWQLIVLVQEGESLKLVEILPGVLALVEDAARQSASGFSCRNTLVCLGLERGREVLERSIDFNGYSPDAEAFEFRPEDLDFFWEPPEVPPGIRPGLLMEEVDNADFRREAKEGLDALDARFQAMIRNREDVLKGYAGGEYGRWFAHQLGLLQTAFREYLSMDRSVHEFLRMDPQKWARQKVQELFSIRSMEKSWDLFIRLQQPRSAQEGELFLAYALGGLGAMGSFSINHWDQRFLELLPVWNRKALQIRLSRLRDWQEKTIRDLRGALREGEGLEVKLLKEADCCSYMGGKEIRFASDVKPFALFHDFQSDFVTDWKRATGEEGEKFCEDVQDALYRPSRQGSEFRPFEKITEEDIRDKEREMIRRKEELRRDLFESLLTKPQWGGIKLERLVKTGTVFLRTRPRRAVLGCCLGLLLLLVCLSPAASWGWAEKRPWEEIPGFLCGVCFVFLAAGFSLFAVRRELKGLKKDMEKQKSAYQEEIRYWAEKLRRQVQKACELGVSRKNLDEIRVCQRAQNNERNAEESRIAQMKQDKRICLQVPGGVAGLETAPVLPERTEGGRATDFLKSEASSFTLRYCGSTNDAERLDSWVYALERLEFRADERLSESGGLP